MNVKKVVTIVVALHVLIIGGIFVFEGCSRTKAPTPDMASNESSPGQAPTMAAAPETTTPVTSQTLTPAMPVAQPQPTVTTVAATPAAAPAGKTYVVKKGDSLWKIAKLEGISVGEIARANNITKTTSLKIGQKLQIPAATKTEPTTATASVIPTGATAPSADLSAPVDSSSGGNVYTVQSGDSLWKIARKQNVTVASLKSVNNLSSDSLKVGQKLHIPAAPNTASAGVATSSTKSAFLEPGKYTENGQTIHIVDINETPAIIAKKYGIKTDDLMKANNITDPTKLTYGQRLIIPTGTPVASAAPITPAPVAATAAPAPTSVPTTAATTPTVSSAPPLAAPVVSASQVTVQ